MMQYIRYRDVYRVYKENNSLVILYVNGDSLKFENLDNNKLKRLEKEIQNGCLENGFRVEVYNGRDEAESYR